MGAVTKCSSTRLSAVEARNLLLLVDIFCIFICWCRLRSCVLDSSVILRHISMGTKMLLSHILLEASDEEIASEISVLYLQGYQSLCNSLPNMNGKFVYRLQCYQPLEISSYHFIISIFFSEKNIYSQFISRLLPHRKEHLNSYVIPFIDESYSGRMRVFSAQVGDVLYHLCWKKG